LCITLVIYQESPLLCYLRVYECASGTLLSVSSFDSFYHLFSLKQLYFDSNPRGTPVENHCS